MELLGYLEMFSKLRVEATLGTCVEVSGIGVHSGLTANVRIYPAREKVGIVFKRVDVLDKDPWIRLSADSVVDPTLCTRVVNREGVSVSVIEHLLAAFRICGVTNAIIEIDAPEVPIMDGSAIEFVRAFKDAGIVSQSEVVPAIKIKKPVTVSSENGVISILPSDDYGISVKLDYERVNAVIGDNNSYKFYLGDNLTMIAESRTFGWVADYAKVTAMGLAKGTSEENTVAIMDDNSIKNSGGLRNPKELVMHKCLDLIGDISVIGFDIFGEIKAINPSHSLNNSLMTKLMAELSDHEVRLTNESDVKVKDTHIAHQQIQQGWSPELSF